MRRSRGLPRNDPRRFGKAIEHRSEDQPVIPPETFAATHGLQKQEREDKAFGQGTAPRAEPGFAAAITANVRRNERPVGRVVHLAPQSNGRRRGGEPIECILHLGARECIPAALGRHASGVWLQALGVIRNNWRLYRSRSAPDKGHEARVSLEVRV